MKIVLVSIYIDPEFYPPTKNAIIELAKVSQKVIVLTRNLYLQEKNDYLNAAKYLDIAADLRLKDITRNLPLLNETEKLAYVNKNYFFFNNFFYRIFFISCIICMTPVNS